MAKRYIDADKTKRELLENAVRIYDPKNMSTEDAMYIIDEQPTADVVEVVRCKDCKHQEQCCEFIMISGKDKNIDFCSYGERRTDDDL